MISVSDPLFLGMTNAIRENRGRRGFVSFLGVGLFVFCFFNFAFLALSQGRIGKKKSFILQFCIADFSYSNLKVICNADFREKKQDIFLIWQYILSLPTLLNAAPHPQAPLILPKCRQRLLCKELRLELWGE